MTPGKLVYDKGVEPVPGYRLTDYLGGGSFGEVWKTIDLSTSKHFALKIIDLSYSSSALKELRALKLVMNLNHPNLVPITKAWLKDKHGQSLDLHSVDLVKQKGKLKLLLILMGLGEKSLSARLKEVNRAAGRADADDEEGLPVGIPPEELANYMRGAAKGIDYLNAVRHEGVDAASDGPIVHCDIKPDNMMIVAGTEVQIADCGVAVSLNQDTRKTVSAAFSPVYAPPELSNNRPATGTDQYSLAISYYELRTGLRPFSGDMNQFEMMTAHALGNLDFSSPILTAGERKVLKWATSPALASRYPSCFDMVKQLERGMEGLPPRAPNELHKSVPVILVPPAPKPGSAPRIAVPKSDHLDMTSAHHVDLFTPPPQAATPGSEPYPSDIPAGSRPDAAPPAPKAPSAYYSRPSILEDPNDPNGRELPPPELDDELRRIIAGSQIVAALPRRRLPDEPEARQSTAPPVVPRTSGLVETQIKTDTDAPQVVDLVATTNPAETDSRSVRRPAARREYDGTVVPGRQEYEAPPETRKPSRPAKPTASGPKYGGPATGQRSMAPMIGVAGGVVILLAGGVGAYFMLPPSSSPITSVTPGTTGDGGRGPVTTKSTEGDTRPTTKVDPVDDEQQRFARQLAALRLTLPSHEELAALLARTERGTPQRRQLIEALPGNGSDARRLADLADFATIHNKWDDFEDRRADLAKAWYDTHVQAPYTAAFEAVEGKPTADEAKAKLAGLRKALDLPAAKQVATVMKAEIDSANQLSALGVAWSNGEKSLEPLAKLLTQGLPPPGGKFFAAEYFRLARNAELPIGELRVFRDSTKAWSGIDESYQAALADHVVKALCVEKPDWDAIDKTCGKDVANGWKSLAAADKAVANPTGGNVNLAPLQGVVGKDGPVFAKYLECCAKNNIDGLVNVFKGPELPVVLNTRSRKKLAGELILKNTPLVKVHREWEKQPVVLFFTNPYEKEGGLGSMAARLDTCAKLLGSLEPTERIHRYLISAAANATNKPPLAELTVDEDALDYRDIAPTLACYKLLAQDASLNDADRAAAAARAYRLAFRQIDLSFVGCDTYEQAAEREVTLNEVIGAAVSASLLDAKKSAKSAKSDLMSLEFSQLRANINAKLVTDSTRLGKLQDILPQLDNALDRAACLAMRAFYKLLDRYAKDPSNATIWDEIKQDAMASLRLRADGYAASVVMCMVYCGEYKYKDKEIYKFRAPSGREIQSKEDIDSALKHFKATRAILRTRKSRALDEMQTNFMDLRITQLTDADPDDKLAPDMIIESTRIGILMKQRKTPKN